MSTRKGRAKISKKDILKILFQTKQRLSADNPIRNALPYYWYKEGPYSTVIYETMDRLQNNGLISLSDSGYMTYLFNPNKIGVPLMNSNEHMREAKNAIESVVDEFTHIQALVEDIYNKAPYKWYDTYNLKFKNHFSNFCCKVSSNNTKIHSREDILRELEDVVLDFPQFPEFPELRRILMRFVRILNSFLHTGNCLEHKDIFPILDKISNSIWDVFAYGVRINHHDTYYADRVDRWVKMYDDEMDKLDADLCLEQEKVEQISTYVVKLAPHIIDMKQHPEKYDFEKLDVDRIIN